jgi:serine/threonine-protein kinase RsbT
VATVGRGSDARQQGHGAEGGVLHHECKILGHDYAHGGRASVTIARLLADAGVDRDLVHRVCVACYEAEMNIVLYARSGVATVDLYPDRVMLCFEDDGPGIADTRQALTPGWSSASREAMHMGFGAGLGLNNIAQQADEMRIHSEPGRGVRLVLTFWRDATAP